MDPREGCGSCINQKDLYAELYPKWVTPADVSLSELDGLAMQFEEQRNRYKVCPYKHDSENPCEDGEYWNELAC